ncbi:hypothetical protein LCGC14_3129780, partial [marine sediment metagenome]
WTTEAEIIHLTLPGSIRTKKTGQQVVSVQKATNSQIIEAYSKHGNIWKAAKDLGMCGQSVHERLVKLGIKCEGRGKNISSLEYSIIKKYYESTPDEKFDRKELLKKLPEKRTLSTLEYVAGNIGLGNKNRSHNLKTNKRISEIKKNTPRDPSFTFKGRKHREQSKGKISKTLKAHWEDPKSVFNDKEWRRKLKERARVNGRNAMFTNPYSRCKQGYYEITNKGKMFFRSKWEANYALYLDFLIDHKEIIKWEYEPDSFMFEQIKLGTRSYTPDFKIFNNSGDFEYHEVKGYMDSKSKTKLKRMAKYYPDTKLILIE